MPSLLPGSGVPCNARLGPFPVLAGWLLGTVLQLQQAELWSAWAYGWTALGAVAGVALAWCHRFGRRVRAVWLLLGIAALAAALTGWRSLYFEQSALDPRWEGRDVLVQGVVSQLPQQQPHAWRFRLRPESALLDGQSIRLPPLLDVGWYAGVHPRGHARAGSARELPPLRAGERWRLSLRLKAPHGQHNPHGFDYELWLWEQGLQATAYVRSGPHDVAPLRLAQTGQAPVAQARQWVRERIQARLGESPQAPLVAALVLGEQSAIRQWWITNKS